MIDEVHNECGTKIEWRGGVPLCHHCELVLHFQFDQTRTKFEWNGKTYTIDKLAEFPCR